VRIFKNTWFARFARKEAIGNDELREIVSQLEAGQFMDNKYQSDFLGSLHETAIGLHKIGVINDDEMQEYDRNCIDPDKVPGAVNHQKQSATPAFARPQ
jgi:hypothetical protein